MNHRSRTCFLGLIMYVLCFFLTFDRQVITRLPVALLVLLCDCLKDGKRAGKLRRERPKSVKWKHLWEPQ